MSTESLERRFQILQRAFEACSENGLADAPLDTWTRASDRHLPSILMQLSLREILETPFHRLASTRGVGDTKLERLVQIVERAVNALHEASPRERAFRQLHMELANAPGSPTRIDGSDDESRVSRRAMRSVVFAPDQGSLNEEQWQMLGRCIRLHRLEDYPLGRFARSLRDLPRGLWNEPLSLFVNCTLAKTIRFPGYGPERLQCVLDVVTELGTILNQIPTDSHYKLQVMPAAIRDLSSWIERVLGQEQIPDFDELRQLFILPLLNQLEADLDQKVAEMVERRLGPDGTPQTLDEIASEFDLTRERIRQLTSRAPEVFAVRWPEGKHLLDDFYERFHKAPRADEQIQLVKRALDILFRFSTDAGTSSEDVIAAWETAGRRKQTPMTPNEIQCWLACEFPSLAPEVGLKWIEEEARLIDSDNGRQLYFSNDDLDLLLFELYRRGSPTAIEELLDIDGRQQRNVRVRISRDIRFVEDEYKRLLPAESCSFVRFSDIWHVDLIAAKQGTRPTCTSITVEGLSHLTISGLLEAGIADATVWGVHRYANEMLGRMFAAKLPEQVTPFILADMFVRQTGSLIRPMRRRRLRWDNAQISIPVRGKRGWVGYAVSQNGIPITLDELGDLLRRYYQDYAGYVLAQLNLEAEEEGEFHCSATLLPGIAHRMPPLLVPADWQFDSDQENVSEEIKLIATKIIGMAREGTLARDDLGHVPWLVQFVEQQAYGEEIWQERAIRRTESITEQNDTDNRNQDTRLRSVKRRQDKDTVNPSDVDDLLAKFL